MGDASAARRPTRILALRHVHSSPLVDASGDGARIARYLKRPELLSSPLPTYTQPRYLTARSAPNVRNTQHDERDSRR
jgi:hypothetical protein